MKHLCQLCGGTSSQDLYDTHLCETCLEAIKFHTDETIKRNRDTYTASDAATAETYADNIVQKLKEQQRIYLRGKIQLLHIQERLKCLK